MTFRRWLSRYLEEQTPIGDLARDVHRDPNRGHGSAGIFDRVIAAGHDAAIDTCIFAIQEWRRQTGRAPVSLKRPPAATMVSIDDAARLLSLSPRVIARLIKEEKIASKKIGRRRVIAYGELTRFVESLEE